MANAGQYKHPIQIIKTKFVQDAMGSMVKSDDAVINTRAKIVHNGGGRGNQNGDIFFEYGKTFQVRIYVPCEDYDEVQYNCKRWRITSIETNEDYRYKTITTEEINT